MARATKSRRGKGKGTISQEETREKLQEAQHQEQQGMLATVGYAHPDAAAIITAWMESNPSALLVDIRYSPHSRWSPHWSRKALEAAWGGRYRHIRTLGNVNYNRPGLSIQLADAEAGVRWAVEALQAGHSLLLLCACREYEHCHRKLVEEQVMQAIKTDATK